jgi:predicted dehydrogenase
MIRLGVVGYGYWGPNLVRNFMEIPNSKVTAICEPRADRLASAMARYPTVRGCRDLSELLEEVDAVAVATPVRTHHAIAKACLEAGRHVLVEKPFTATSSEALELIDLAGRRNLVLMVDHTFVYTPAVEQMRRLVKGGELGEIFYYDSVRVNLGLFQTDVNVLWDLAVHDFSIMDHLLESRPVAVSATAMAHVPAQPENTAYVTLFFADNLIAHVHVNWLAPVKFRRTLIGGSSRMVVYDDLEPSEKVKIYDKGVTLHRDPASVMAMRIGYRAGDMWAPRLALTEALLTEAHHFIACIEKGEHPITDAQSGLRVVRILEAASASIAERGRPVELSRD